MSTQNAESGAWWREHPAYQTIVDTFRQAHVNNGPTLAFLVLRGLRREGWDVTSIDGSEATP